MCSEENLLMSLATKADAAGMTVLVLIFFFCIYRLKSKRPRNPELPPGPSPWPIIGNLHMLGQLPHRALKDLADKYGPIMFLQLGSVPTLVASAPEMAKHFLQTHDLAFASRPATAAGKYLAYNFRDVGLAPYGDYWRQTRKICILELFTAKRIESFQSGRDEEVSAMILSIWKESEKGAKPVNVSKALLSFMTNIICRLLMGRKCRTDVPDNLGSLERMGQIVRDMTPLTGAFYIGDFIPSLSWLDLQGITGRMKKVNGEFDAVWGEDALAFKPERFMQPDGTNRNVDVRGRDFELIPFGSGRRGCPGMALALEVVSVAFSHLLHCFNWSLEYKDGIQEELNMSESFGITMPRRFELFATPSLRLTG